MNVTGISSVGIAGAVIALLQATIALLVAFGVPVTAEQGAAITAVATALYTTVPMVPVVVTTDPTI